MNISRTFSQLIEERKKYQYDIDYDTNPVIRKMISLLSGNTAQTILFINTECTAEQMVWMSEIFDELIEKTQSTELISALYKLAEKYPDAAKKYNVKYFIDSASECIRK